jgi:hypothetical protein
MEDVGILDDYLVYFTVIWYILLSLGAICHVWVCCTEKNLTTLVCNIHSKIVNVEASSNWAERAALKFVIFSNLSHSRNMSCAGFEPADRGR